MMPRVKLKNCHVSDKLCRVFMFDCRRFSYHGCSCGPGSTARLTDLLLTGFDFGLQVCRRVKILALLPGAAALDVVHANSDCVIGGVNHRAVTGVSKTAIRLPSGTIPPLKLTAHLDEEQWWRWSDDIISECVFWPQLVEHKPLICQYAEASAMEKK